MKNEFYFFDKMEGYSLGDYRKNPNVDTIYFDKKNAPIKNYFNEWAFKPFFLFKDCLENWSFYDN